jgi:gamma-glutamyltranspeptidase/glutathione hydrolase
VSRSIGAATVHAQPPSSQALLALMALGELDDLASRDRGRRVHVAVEALEGAFAHRHEITSPAAERRLLEVPLGVDLKRAQRRGGPTVHSHTTALAAADVNGMVVSMVVSVFDEFGCATLVPEGGFFLNNRMHGFARDGEDGNRAAPSTRPVHTLSPLLVETRELSFAIATPGADGQVQTLTQLLDAILVEGLTIPAALDRRRWRSTDRTLMVEAGFEPALLDALLELGHEVSVRPAGDPAFGAAVVAGVELQHASALAVADLRREAWAAAY